MAHKIGICGCGDRVRWVAGLVVDLCDEIEVAGVFDPDDDSVKHSEERFGAVKRFDTYEEMLQDDSISWIFIGSWNSFHVDQIEAAYNAGKHVFSEKPLAVTMEECDRIENFWKNKDQKFCLGLTLRYSPHYQKMKDMLNDGALGQIISFEFNETLGFNHGGFIMGDWRRHNHLSGPHVLEKCCHDIDIIQWLIDSTPTKVASFGGTNIFIPENEGLMEKVGDSPDGRKAFMATPWTSTTPNINPFTSDKSIMDNQVAILEFKNGARASFHTNMSASITERRIYILGTEGSIRADVLTGKIEYKKIGFDTEVIDASSNASGGHGGGDEILAQSIVDCIISDATPLTGITDGVNSSRTALAIQQAAETGAIVIL